MPRIAPAPLHLVPQEEIDHFTLEEMFPAGHIFVLHRPLRTLTHLCLEPDTPSLRLLAQTQFTERELDLVQPLYQHYPQFVPYEILWVCFHRGYANLNEQTLAEARQRLGEVRQDKVRWDAEIGSTQNLMARTRPKLREVGLEVVSMLATGYLLMKHPQW